MSDETNKTNTAEATAKPAETKPKSEPKLKPATKPKAEAKPKAESGSVLKAAGREACRRHKLPEVWVTADGQSFTLECDAKAHAANLSNKQIENVKA